MALRNIMSQISMTFPGGMGPLPPPPVGCATACQGQIQEFTLGGAMANALREAITGSGGRAPAGV